MRKIVTILAVLVLAFALAACGGGDGNGDDTAGGAGDDTIVIEAGDLYFDPEDVSAPAGTIEFELANVGESEHNIVIEEAGDTEVAGAAAGETATGSIELEAGSYTFYCSVPGHRDAGMEGTLEVN